MHRQQVVGILRLINFAHGDIFMMAGFFMVYLSATMPIYISIPAVLLLTVALGVLVERVAYNPLMLMPMSWAVSKSLDTARMAIPTLVYRIRATRPMTRARVSTGVSRSSPWASPPSATPLPSSSSSSC